MIKVEFFGNYRLEFKTAELEINAATVKDLLAVIAEKFPVMPEKEIMRATLFINDKAAQGIFRNRIRLNDGDKVLMMYPSAGG